MNSKFKFRIFNFRFRILFFVLFIACASVLMVHAQKRDNLTAQEDEVMREVQELDARMEIFTKVIERRLLALSDANAAQSKQSLKDKDKWGELRTGSPAEMFYDIQKTLDEAIVKIDDAAGRDQKNPLFGKAVRILASSCGRFLPQFKSFQEKAADPKERVLISQSIENCNLVIEAATKVPAAEKKKN